MTPERLRELAQYNRAGRAGGFMLLIPAPTIEEMAEVFELARKGLITRPKTRHDRRGFRPMVDGIDYDSSEQ